MADGTVAAILFLIYAVNDQWAFRCQRVVRGILLLVKDSAAAHHTLFSNLMPSRYVAAIWIGRLLWSVAAVFAWRAWSWYGVVPLVLYGSFLGFLVDIVSPWPSYRHLLDMLRVRIRTGAAGVEGFSLLPAIDHVLQELQAGVDFEKATTDVWIGRATATAREAAGADRKSHKDAR